MKIGLFGDSFAHDDETKTGKSYIEYLNERNDFEIVAHGMSGSGMYYSYKKFLEHNKDYQKVIFITTHPGRLWLRNSKNSLVEHTYNLASAEHLLKHETKLKTEDVKRLTAVVDYVKYIYNQEEQQDYWKLMLDRIKSIRPDALIIDAFHIYKHDDNTKTINETDCIVLEDLARLDLMKNGKPILGSLGVEDMRKTHLSEANSIVFANKILEWIKTGNWYFKDKDEFFESQGIEAYYNDRR